jgi:hypothetical protein
MEAFIPYVPLANFMVVVFVIPMWRLGTAMFQSNKNQQAELAELKKMTRALTVVSMKFLPPDAAREYLHEMGKNESR